MAKSANVSRRSQNLQDQVIGVSKIESKSDQVIGVSRSNDNSSSLKRLYSGTLDPIP